LMRCARLMQLFERAYLVEVRANGRRALDQA
jgi:hypothetical protein